MEPTEGQARPEAGGGEEGGLMEGDGIATRANNSTHLGCAINSGGDGGPAVGARVNEGELIYQLHR